MVAGELINCYDTLLGSRMGSSNEERRGDSKNICKEDQLDTGSRASKTGHLQLLVADIFA